MKFVCSDNLLPDIDYTQINNIRIQQKRKIIRRKVIEYGGQRQPLMIMEND